MINLSEALDQYEGSGVTAHALADLHECLVVMAANGWLVGFRLVDTDSRHSRVVESSIRMTAADSNMSGDSLRKLPMGELIAQARKSASDRQRGTSPFVVPSDLPQLRCFDESARGKGRPDRDFALLAEAYVQLINAGDRAPAKTFSEKLGSTQSAWVNRVLEARRRGLLTPVGRGEAGGELTEVAEALLFGTDQSGE